jgi:hypothetical protein
MFRFLDNLGNPIDFTGQPARAQVRARPQNTLVATFVVTVFAPSHSENSGIGALVGGWIGISLSEAALRHFTPNYREIPKPYWWDLFLGDRCYLEGSAEIVWSIVEGQ